MVRPTLQLGNDTLSIGEIIDTPNNSQLYTPNPYLHTPNILDTPYSQHN